MPRAFHILFRQSALFMFSGNFLEQLGMRSSANILWEIFMMVHLRTEEDGLGERERNGRAGPVAVERYCATVSVSCITPLRVQYHYVYYKAVGR